MYDEVVRETLITCLKHVGCNDSSTINDTLCSLRDMESANNVMDSLNDTWNHWIEENYNNPYPNAWPDLVRRKKTMMNNEARKKDITNLTEFSLLVTSIQII